MRVVAETAFFADVLPCCHYYSVAETDANAELAER
jgi:hypothetical protein